MSSSLRCIAMLVLIAGSFGCGKKGPALPPFRPTLGAVHQAELIQLGDQVRLVVGVPNAYADGQPFELESVEVLVLESDGEIRGGEAESTESGIDQESAARHERRRAPLPMASDAGSSKTRPELQARPTIEPSAAPSEGGVEAAEPFDSLTPVEQSSTVDDAELADVERRAREKRHRSLTHRFEKSAKRRVELDTPEKLEMVRNGTLLELPLEVATDVGTAAAVAVELRGSRKGDRGTRSGILLFDPIEPPPRPSAPRVSNAPSGLRIDLGPEAEVLSLVELLEVDLLTWPGAVLRRAPVMALFRRDGGATRFSSTPWGEALQGRQLVFDRDVTEGREVCFAIARAAEASKPKRLSALSEISCVTRRDTFPPDPPAQPRAFPSRDGVLLVWQPSTSADVSGYRVYRGLSGQRLEPIADTAQNARSYLDQTAESRVVYDYQVSALDTAKPANESAPTGIVSERAP